MFKTAYGEKNRSPIYCDEETLTQQNFKQECDINHILSKYQKTGIVEHANRFQGDYSDVTGAVDYQTALNIINDANDAFNSLPSSVRKKFANDPAAFVDYVSDPENIDSMRELGLALYDPNSKDVEKVPEPPKTPEE